MLVQVQAQPISQSALSLISYLADQSLIGNQLDLRGQIGKAVAILPDRNFYVTDNGIAPNDFALFGKAELIVGGQRDCLRALAQSLANGFFNRRACGAAGGRFQTRVALDMQAVQAPHIFFGNQNIAIGFYFRHNFLFSHQAAHQGRGFTVHKLPHKFHMQSVRQAFFNLAAGFLPMLRVGQPVIALGNICRGANMRQPCR